MAVTPDLAGFTEAQRRGRELFGEDVVFLEAAEVTFAPDVPLDPETGEPFDPTVRPSASAQASAVVNCNVAFKAINRAGIGGDVTGGALGEMERTHVMLIADIDDRATIEGAREFEVRGDRFLISSAKPDGIAGVQRMLVYGRRE